ncbi:MAG: GntR family transcriptional regulator [Longimicrobiales bacterium]
MSRELPGSIIVDQLRDRIVTGIFLGSWQPGERLPSIRDVADAESVDRKTAAAAYRRLEEEGLVRVRARSGVYLRTDGTTAQSSPLERLHRRWLRNTYEGGRELGLDTGTMLRLLESIAAIEETAIPVVESDSAMASLIADELQQRVRLHAVPASNFELRHLRDQYEHAPFVVTTPFCHQLTALQSTFKTVVQATLAPELLDALRVTLSQPRALVIAPCEAIASKIQRAIEQGQLGALAHAPTVINAQQEPDIIAHVRAASTILLWPGCISHVERQLEGYACTKPERLLSEPCLAAVRAAILDAAMTRFASMSSPGITSSNGDAARRIPAAASRAHSANPIRESGLLA